MSLAELADHKNKYSVGYPGLTCHQEWALENAAHKAHFIHTVERKNLANVGVGLYGREKADILAYFFPKFAPGGSQDLADVNPLAIGRIFDGVYCAEKVHNSEYMKTISQLTRKIKT